MASLLFGIDNETVLDGNYFDHRIDHGERLVFYAKDLALVNSLMAKHLDTQFCFNGFSANIYTGTFSTKGQDAAIYDSMNLKHQGYGSKGLVALAGNGLGLILKALNHVTDTVFCAVQIQKEVEAHAANVKFMHGQNKCALHGGVINNKHADIVNTIAQQSRMFKLQDVYDITSKVKAAGVQ